jgi:Membrane protein involved in the export of O-antigen and teichoic acid
MMNRNRYLVKNTALFALSNLGTKLISFLLVPLYTNILTTAEYGTIDLIATLCTLLVPVVTANMAEAVIRFSLDQGADHGKIMGVAILCGVAGAAILLLVYPIAGIWGELHEIDNYIYWFCCTFALAQIFMNYLRGSERLLAFSIGNIIQTFCVACFSIAFLTVWKLGVRGYFLAYICSYAITGVFAVIMGKIPSLLQSLSPNLQLFRQMARYSVALIPNNFLWWVMNSSDRIIVTTMLGVTVNGVYSVAYKIPSVLTVVSTIFTQAWMYSSIHENESNDRDEYTNNVYSKLFLSMVVVGGVLLAILKPFMRLYVGDAYYTAWQYSPYLIMGFIFMSMGTFIGTPYLVHKDSLHFMVSGISGAIINIILTLVLVPWIGANGAAIATCASYIGVYAYRAADTRKYIKLKLFDLKIILSLGMVFIMSITVYLDSTAGTVLLYTELAILIFILRKFFSEMILQVRMIIVEMVRKCVHSGRV